MAYALTHIAVLRSYIVDYFPNTNVQLFTKTYDPFNSLLVNTKSSMLQLWMTSRTLMFKRSQRHDPFDSLLVRCSSA